MSGTDRTGPGGRPPLRPRPLLRSALGVLLRRHRQRQGRTLADVARAARVSMPYLSEVERGRKEASSEVLAAICGALGIDLPDLLTEAGRELAGSGQAQVIRLGDARLGSGRTLSPGPVRDGTRPADSSPGQAGPLDARCLLAA